MRGKLTAKDWYSYGLIILFAFLPFHAFLTTWLGQLFGHRPIWQAWKEALVIILAMGLLWQTVRNSNFRKILWSYWPNRLILIYAALHLLLISLQSRDFGAALLGLRNNLIFLAVFIVAQAVATRLTTNFLKLISRVILVAAAIVATFGIFQAYLLPWDFLTNFGYSDQTVPPYLFLQDSQIARILSTLDSPNTLGSYLILPWSLLVSGLVGGSLKKYWWWLAPVLVITLYHSHSRSAWLGIAIATALILWRLLARALLRKILITMAILSFITVGAGFYLIPRYPNLQSVILHSPLEKAPDESSNADHLDEIIKGGRDLFRHPLGKGPGAAGPASLRSSEPDITENYSLQIGLEVGLIGLALFVALNLLIVKDLITISRRSLIAIALVASWLGLTFMNLLLHTWTNAPTAVIWWGLAGLIIGAWRLKLRPKSTSNIGHNHS